MVDRRAYKRRLLKKCEVKVSQVGEGMKQADGVECVLRRSEIRDAASGLEWTCQLPGLAGGIESAIRPKGHS